MAKRIQNTDTAEQANPFLEEGSLEPETDESSFDDEDPLAKKKKRKAKKRAAPKRKAAAEVEVDADETEADELTQTDALADEDETPDEAVQTAKPARKTKVVAEKRTVLVADAPTEPTRREPAAPVPSVPALSAEDLMKTMTAAFEKTTTSLREIPVEIATSLEQARDEAELRSSFVSKLTLGLSAAACVLSLLAVGLAQSTRHQQLQVEAPSAPTARVAQVSAPAERTVRTEPTTETTRVAPRAERHALRAERSQALAAAKAAAAHRRAQSTAATPLVTAPRTAKRASRRKDF